MVSAVKESEVAQLCLTLCNPMDYSLPDSSVHGIFQARILEWGAADGKYLCCSVLGNALGKCQFVADSMKRYDLRLLIFLPAILIPACASSSPAFLMMHSAYKLNSRVIIYSLEILLFLFGTSLLFHVQF